jgi:ubiquinone/menaquinone biosynthesis C-methylase UbiE
MKEQLIEKLLNVLTLHPDENLSILEIGCGYGHLLGALRNLTSTNSRLVGIDPMEVAINYAKSVYSGIDFQLSKFEGALNYPDKTFDLVVSVDTIECIPDKPAFIHEIHRVLKQGGTVLVAHWDWDTQTYYSEHKEVIRLFVAKFSDWQQDWMDACDGQMGRKLWGLFESSGKFSGKAEVFTLIETEFKDGCYGYDRLQDLGSLVNKGEVCRDEYELIMNEMKDLSYNNKYFYALNSFIYKGESV